MVFELVQVLLELAEDVAELRVDLVRVGVDPGVAGDALPGRGEDGGELVLLPGRGGGQVRESGGSGVDVRVLGKWRHSAHVLLKVLLDGKMAKNVKNVKSSEIFANLKNENVFVLILSKEVFQRIHLLAAKIGQIPWLLQEMLYFYLEIVSKLGTNGFRIKCYFMDQNA